MGSAVQQGIRQKSWGPAIVSQLTYHSHAQETRQEQATLIFLRFDVVYLFFHPSPPVPLAALTIAFLVDLLTCPVLSSHMDGAT